jgi:rod shape-determining protein MreC
VKFIYSKEFKYVAAALIVAALLVFAHAVGFLSPVEAGIADVPRPFVFVFERTGSGVQSFFGIFSSVHTLKTTNATLESQNVALEEEVAGLQQSALENQVLRQELNYRSTSDLKLISANVIGKNPGGFAETLTIDQGSHDGVKVGDAVVAQGVFVGRISATTDYNAQVLLVSDSQSSIDAKIGASGDTGVLDGSFGSGMTISMISQTSTISQGDEVLTAGLTDNTPSGLLIGTIGDVESGKNQLLQNASVVSPINLRTLTFLAVVAQ